MLAVVWVKVCGCRVCALGADIVYCYRCRTNCSESSSAQEYHLFDAEETLQSLTPKLQEFFRVYPNWNFILLFFYSGHIFKDGCRQILQQNLLPQAHWMIIQCWTISGTFPASLENRLSKVVAVCTFPCNHILRFLK